MSSSKRIVTLTKIPRVSDVGDLFDNFTLVCESKYMEDQTQGQTGQVEQPVQAAAPAQPAPAVAPEMAPAKKSSWAKTLLIYVVLAVVVYAVIYYLFLN